jgi:hypothetical protein
MSRLSNIGLGDKGFTMNIGGGVLNIVAENETEKTTRRNRIKYQNIVNQDCFLCLKLFSLHLLYLTYQDYLAC